MTPTFTDLAAVLERLTLARKRAGLSRVEAGHRLFLSDETVRSYENGQRTLAIERLMEMCHVYGASAEWVLTGREVAEERTP